MRKFLVLFVFLLFLFLANLTFAQVIQTGDAKAETKVETNVSGENVYTKIEVEANGEKKVLETKEPGVHKLEVNSNEETQIIGEEVSPSVTITPEIEQVKKTADKTTNGFNLMLDNFKNWIVNLLDSLNFFN